VSDQFPSASIVAAVDGSVHAERALRWAAEQALLEGRRLVALTAGEGAESVVREAVALAQRLYPRLSVEGRSRSGDPRHVLIELSREAQLLVLGSHGRGPLKTLFLGSVSAAVSAHAACPVVVCRPDHSGRGVLVGADGSPESIPVVEFAYRQASLRQWPLTVMHCFWDAVVIERAIRYDRNWTLDDADVEDLRAVLAESVAGLGTRYPDVQVTLTLKHGLVDEALASSEEPWDLIVVGRHPMTTVTRVFTGSIASAVLERAHSPVAVVPERAATA
jgi:nucleotide-binding universal stress UspA family protein